MPSKQRSAQARPNPRLQAALAYAALGYRVLPLHYPTAPGVCSCEDSRCIKQGKHPYGLLAQHGAKSASRDPEILKKWWGKQPSANIGLVSADGLCVVDVDPRNGGQETWESHDLEEPETPQSITGRGDGGRHLFFRLPGGELPSQSFHDHVAPGLDLIVGNKYIVAPGSIHGETMKPYVWRDGFSLEDMEPEELPAPIIDLLEQSAALRGSSNSAPEVDQTILDDVKAHPEKYERQKRIAQGCLKRACSKLENFKGKGRSPTIFRSANHIGRYVGAALLDPQASFDALVQAASGLGVKPSEVRRQITNGLKTGVKEPVDPLGLPGLKGRAHAGPSSHTLGIDSRVAIHIEPGNRPETARQIAEAMADARKDNPLLFNRSGQLMRLVLHPMPLGGSASPPPTLVRVTRDWLQVEAEKDCRFLKPSRGNGDWIPTDCPKDCVAPIISDVAEMPFPPLSAVLLAPSITLNDTLLTEDGYDMETGTYLHSGLSTPLTVPDAPSEEDARTALDCLKDLLREFGFHREEDQAAAIAMLLTAVLRPCLDTAPAFVVESPLPSSGKTTLCQMGGIIATGQPVPTQPFPTTEAEVQKSMLAALLTGAPIHVLDEMPDTVTSPTLSTILTARTFNARILGCSETATVPTNALFTFAGNNIRFIGGLATRVVPCRLNRRSERPEEHRYSRDILKYTMTHRAGLIEACLVILRYGLQLEPEDPTWRPSRYGDWDRVVRGVLIRLGHLDPLARQHATKHTDPARELLKEFIAACLVEMPEPQSPWLTKDLAALANKNPEGNLAVVLRTISGDEHGSINTRKVGRFLRNNLDIPEQGVNITRSGKPDSSGRQRWVLKGAGTGEEAGFTGFSGFRSTLEESEEKSPTSEEGCKPNLPNLSNLSGSDGAKPTPGTSNGVEEEDV